MRAEPLPLVGGAYTDDARPWSLQDTCNYLPTSAEKAGTRSPDKLKTPPGLRPFVEVITEIEPGIEEYTPVRGVHEAEGRLFAVIGETLYRISNAGVAIPLGTVPGRGRVSMEHNQISLGNQLTVMNGSAGYVYNTVTDTFERIADPGFPGSFISLFIDGYIIGIEPQGRYAFNSAPADALDYNTLDRFTSEVRPDKLVSGAVSNNELVLFSASSGEFFQNTGASEQPFRTKRITMDKGAAGAYVVATADNTVYWLANDGVFFQLDGYTPRRISTRPIEQAIRGLNWSEAFAYVWEDEGHTVIYWTFPDGQTWGYDASEREWHRRESYGLDRWRVSGMAYWNNRWIAGDFQKGRLWYVDWEYPWEGDQEFISSRTMGVIHDNQSRMLHSRLELVMDTGMPYVEPESFPVQPTAPSLTGDAPTAYTSEAYSYSYTTTGGQTPYTYSIIAGALPDGLTLGSSTGEITGTATETGSFSWTVKVTDANGLSDTLPDTMDVFNFAGIWFFGPVAQNGASGGSEAFYLAANTLDDFASATPIALPAQGSGPLSRISTANNAVFLHRGTTGSVSFDNGATWTACNIPLSADYNVYWNGSFYWNNSQRSADGITWSAITGLPSGATGVWFGRANDGLILAVANSAGSSATIHRSTDNGGIWTAGYAPGVSLLSQSYVTNGTRIWGGSQNSVTGFYSDDGFATGATFGTPSTIYLPFYGDGVVLSVSISNVRRTLENQVTETSVLTANVSIANTIAYGDGEWGVCVKSGSGPAQTVIQASSDDGLTFSAKPYTLYGNGNNLISLPQR